MTRRPVIRHIVITGPNGAGKSHAAARLHAARPDLPIISYDALRLTTNWVKRPASDTVAALTAALSAEGWIVEGGPSMLPHVLPRADAVLWLDPPVPLRAWRLLVRPLRSRGRTRPELPDGNPDHVWPQLRFGWQSLRRDAAFRDGIAVALAGPLDVPVWRCRTDAELQDALLALGADVNTPLCDRPGR